jgi:hypothetical protein
LSDYVQNQSSVFTEDMLKAAIDETANTGIDVHLLQPGFGWVPLWKSRIYSFEEHTAFIKKHTGMEPSAEGIAAYMANGGDVLKVFVSHCRLKGLAPFVSFRLNDSHGHDFATMAQEDIPRWAWHAFCPIHIQHPEWRLGQDIRNWSRRVLNWAIPEVRKYKYSYIKEIIENYDLDGFELDFMRHRSFFRQEETTVEQRKKIMTEFVRDVRCLLDTASRPGQHKWLCVRIPAQTCWYDRLGISVESLVESGVDMINLSNSFYTEMKGDFAAVRKMAGNQASLYFELCHTTQQRLKSKPSNINYDSKLQRKTTPNQYYTAAYLAQMRGCDGCSTFNFAYYRQYLSGGREPSAEPPFYIHRNLGNLEWLSQQNQHYVISEGWMGDGLRTGHDVMFSGWLGTGLPAIMEQGKKLVINQDMAPPGSGWSNKGGRMRIQAEDDLGDSLWEASINGVKLVETQDRSEPYSNTYPQLLGEPEQHRAWLVPAAVLKNGMNDIEIMLKAGETACLICIDLAITGR